MGIRLDPLLPYVFVWERTPRPGAQRKRGDRRARHGDRRFPRDASHPQAHCRTARLRGFGSRQRQGGAGPARRCRDSAGARAGGLEHAGDERAGVRHGRPRGAEVPVDDPDDGHDRGRAEPDRAGPGCRGARVRHQAVHPGRHRREAGAAGPRTEWSSRVNTYQGPGDDDLQQIAEQVWSSYLDMDGASPLIPVPAEKPSSDVSASVSVTGAWRGHVVVRCSAQASRNAAAALLGVELDDVTTEDVTDALGELANIIGGNVKSLLPEPCALSLPHVVIHGESGYPHVVEVCRLSGTWRDESVTICVLESTLTERVG